MWRNLQNNTDVSLIINFQCILHIFTLMHLQTFQRQKITERLWNFLGTLYHVLLSRGKGQQSLFIGCLLAKVIRSKLISVQLDHTFYLG